MPLTAFMLLPKNKSQKSEDIPKRQLWHNHSWVISLNPEAIPKKEPYCGYYRGNSLRLRNAIRRNVLERTSSQPYSEPCQTSKVGLLAKIDHSCFKKSSILDFWQGSEYACVQSNGRIGRLQINQPEIMFIFCKINRELKLLLLFNCHC